MASRAGCVTVSQFSTPTEELAIFVQYLNERQQGALLHYAYEMVRADGRVAASEQVVLGDIRSQMRSGVEAEYVPIADLAGLFEDRLTRIAFMLEIVGVAYVDDSAHAAESALTRDIATALELGEDDIQQAESWVALQMAHVQQAYRLMEG